MSDSSVSSTNAGGQLEPQLESVIAEYIRACETGRSPNRREILEQYPDLAGQLRQFFAQRDRLNHFVEPIRAFGDDLFHAVGTGQQLSYVGNYELLEEVARGGMGIVYKARQTTLGRIVAVKMIVSGRLATEQDVVRFQTEAQAAASLQHPNIVSIHEVGQHEGWHYFSMDYVEGRDLSTILRLNLLPAKTAAAYVRQMAEAIHYAHLQGVLHRDLKPSNILIDSLDQVRITDFGLALRVEGDQSLTQTGQIVGTPSYMPPEQAQCNRALIGPASDVYALGAVLYECLTGRPPFRAESVIKTLDQVIHVEAASPRTLNAAIPRDLETICLKCLEKEPHCRYGTAQFLADDLMRFLHDEPVVARPASKAYRFQKAWQRNKFAFTAAATVVIALVGGIGVSTWQADRANRAKIEAVHAQDEAVAAQATAQSAQKVAETERERANAHARTASESQQQSRRLLYASDMNLAQQTLKLNNLGKVRHLLDRHRPQPGEEDLRGWEWRYLWQLTRSSALCTLTNRPTDGHSVSFSPDGTRLAVGWKDGRVELWDVPGRRLIRALADRANLPPGRATFSPVRNLLAATSEPRFVTLYDLDSGTESILWRAPDKGTWHVRDLAFSPDGSRVVIYAGSMSTIGDEVWVVNVSSSQSESHFPTVDSGRSVFGAARLSPDNQRLYLARSDHLNSHYSIQCIDLTTSKELWQTKSLPDRGLTALAISPDGQMLASGSGYEDLSIRVWDPGTGRPVVRLNGHTGWVGELAFTRDGRRLISAASDQSIRFWDTSTWTETQVLRGHTNEIWAVAISEPAQLVASTGKDGNIILWKEDGKRAADGYRRLPEDLAVNRVMPLDHSRLLLLLPGKSPALVDLKLDSDPVSLPEITSSTDVLDWFDNNILCQWNGTNQILVRELRGVEIIQRGAISLDSGVRPRGVAYNASRQLLAWTEGTSSKSVYLASLTTPANRVELRSDIAGFIPFRFSDDGNFLAATGRGLRVWNVETGQIVASVGGIIRAAAFAAAGQILVVTIVDSNNDHEIDFYDLAHPDRPPQRVPGRFHSGSLAVSPDGGLVASSNQGGEVRLLDPATGELIDTIYGHLNAAHSVAFSPDGRRLISTHGGWDAVKLWDVGTRQELLTLAGTGSTLYSAMWSDDGDVIMAGNPWQSWRAPSWEEIAATETRLEAEPETLNRQSAAEK